uniref:Uncharacterized protein LOC113786269 n=1 Tax=Cicer arietinum TaxID=3827 RepID=A0A3Q7YES6_CICAR|nr:uncharacterized protein LOC113786269 [Cicer arietinum]
MDSPSGFEFKFNQKVCKLQKSLYGLKQSPRAKFESFTQFVKKHGYSQCQIDHTMFVKHSSQGKMAILIVYVDDIVIIEGDSNEIKNLKLAAEFEIKDLEPLKYFLGMEVARSKKWIVVSQQKYILDLLKEIGMMGCRPADTPIDPNQKIGSNGSSDPVDTSRYSFYCYLSESTYALTSRRTFKGCLTYYKVSQKFPRNGTVFHKIDQQGIKVFTDVDWAGPITDKKSTSGYCTFVWGNLVTWRSKKQNVVARSSVEAKYRAMAQGVCEELFKES